MHRKTVLPYNRVHFPSDFHHLRQEQQKCHDACNQVGDENILNTPVTPVYKVYSPGNNTVIAVSKDKRAQKDKEEVQSNVDAYVSHIDGSKTFGPVLGTEPGKRNGGNGIQ